MVKDRTLGQLAQRLVIEVINDVVDHDVHCYISQRPVFPHQVLVAWDVHQPHMQVLVCRKTPHFLVRQPRHELPTILLVQAIGVSRGDAVLY